MSQPSEYSVYCSTCSLYNLDRSEIQCSNCLNKRITKIKKAMTEEILKEFGRYRKENVMYRIDGDTLLSDFEDIVRKTLGKGQP